MPHTGSVAYVEKYLNLPSGTYGALEALAASHITVGLKVVHKKSHLQVVERYMMVNFKLNNPDISILDSDIDALELEVGISFPAEFRALYLSFNGGSPSREFWAQDKNYEPIRIEDFKSVAGAGVVDRAQTKYIGGFYRRMVERNVLPAHLVPFAVDEAGNFICLDKLGGEVVYFSVDVFQPDVDNHINHFNAQKILSLSFSAFIQSLIDEGEVDS
ncbi:SMI1/KNR4 family protein [Pseudomonas promysalinigenes]